MTLSLLSYTAYGTYVMAYYFANKSYIAKELCVQKEMPKGCDGKCYLSKQIAKYKSSKNTPKNNNEENYRININLYIPKKEFSLNTFLSRHLTCIVDKKQYRILSASKAIETPPPRSA